MTGSHSRSDRSYRAETGEPDAGRPARRLRWAALLLAAVSLAGRVEAGQEAALAALQQQLVGAEVVSKIDMPATTDGVDIRLWQEPPIDAADARARIDEHGLAIAAWTRRSVITAVKKKRRHLEIHLDGGGWSGRVPRPPWGANRSIEEISLGFPAPADQRAANRRRQAELQRQRVRGDEEAYARYLEELAEYERAKVAAGSRINLRYRRLGAAELQVEAVKAALADFVGFVPDSARRTSASPAR